MPKSKASSSPDDVSFDLLFQLTYLSAVAAAGIPRSRVFQLASGLPNCIAPYFHKIQVLAEKMHYDYSEACRMVGQGVKDARVKSLLLRISSSLIAGESERDFLEREAKVQAESYSNEYEGKVEVLRKYTDAYTAITISSALVLVVAVVSMLIYNTSTAFLMGLVLVSVGVTGVGVWILHKVAPKENKVLESKVGPPKAKLLTRLFPICVCASVLLPTILSIRHVPSGVLLMVAALPLIPLGLVATSYDRDIEKKDKEISTFLRALGSVATAIGSTLTEGMERLDMRSFVALGPLIKQLHSRLVTRIDPALCWGRLVTDSGSGLISRSVSIFQDAINQGGEAEEVGARSSLMAMKVSTLREKRLIVSNTFGWLTLVMHATITALLVFIVSIVEVFSGMLSGVDMGEVKGMLPFFSFSSADVQLLRYILIPTLILFSLANASAPLVTEGGHKYRFFFFLGFTLAIAGLNLTVVPAAVKWLFNFSPIK